MTAQTLLRVIGNINEELVDGAAEPVKRTANPWVRWGALAASAAIIAGLAYFAPRLAPKDAAEGAVMESSAAEAPQAAEDTAPAEYNVEYDEAKEADLEEAPAEEPEMPAEAPAEITTGSAAEDSSQSDLEGEEELNAERRVDQIHRNSADSFTPKSGGNTSIYDSVYDSLQAFGGNWLPDELEEGRLIDQPIKVTEFAPGQFSAEYHYTASEKYGEVAVTVENTDIESILDGKYPAPGFEGLETYYISVADLDNVFVAQTEDRVYVQFIYRSESITQPEPHLLFTVSCDRDVSEEELIELVKALNYRAMH